MRGILHAIYWKLHAAYILNDHKKAELFLSMLEAENPKKILEEIGAIHFQRFEQIKNNVSFGIFGRLYGLGTSTPVPPDSFKQEPDIQEKKFHQLILSERFPLFSCLGINEKATMLHEVEINPYGRCDFIIKDGRTWYVVEIKIGEAKHDVVSQIDKYRISAELDMCMGLHDHVGAAVVASNFSQYVISELSRMNVVMITHSGTPKSLSRLSRKLISFVE